MATFKVKLSKSDNQQQITIVQADNTDLSGISAVVASVYTDDLSAADNTYTFSGAEVAALAAGSVTLNTEDLIGEAEPDDDFYSVVLSCDSDAYVSSSAGIGITLEAAGKVYNKQGFINVYSHDFRIDRVLHTAHMLLAEMNTIENQEYSLQKRTDFTVRLATLKQILNYE